MARYSGTFLAAAVQFARLAWRAIRLGSDDKQKSKEGELEDDDSDDTVKLEDFQEAQNNHYHKDIMEALKNYPKLSVVNSS